METEPLPLNASMKKIVVSILLALLWPFLCHGQSYEQMSRMDIEDLVGLGTRRLVEENKPDQALMAFTLAMGRYRRNLDESDKRLCMKACYGAWLVYFNHFCNYQKAFESIMTARDIADDIQQDQPKVYLLAGNIYQTISEQSNDSRLMRRAYTYYYKVLDMAIVTHDRSSIDICFSTSSLRPTRSTASTSWAGRGAPTPHCPWGGTMCADATTTVPTGCIPYGTAASCGRPLERWKAKSAPHPPMPST